MGPFRFTSPESPAAVLARLHAEGRRWRPGDIRPEVRRVGTELGVRVDGHRFRMWILGVGRSASMPIADGEVEGAPDGAVITGRIRHAPSLLPLLALWSGGMLWVTVSAGAGWFGVCFSLAWWGAGVVTVLTHRRAAQERALLAVLARCVRGGDSPAQAPPNETLQLTKLRHAP